MIRALVVLGCLASLGGCKKKSEGGSSPHGSGRVLAKMAEFTEAMCGCKSGDTACADKVIDSQKQWGEEMAKTADKDMKPDPELARRLEPIMQRYTKCATKAMTPAGAEPLSGKVERPAAPATLRVETLVKTGRDTIAAADKRLVLSKLEASYVRSDGALDKQYGELELVFKMPPVGDDPKRPIGAPLPKPSPDNDRLDCPTLKIAKGEWSIVDGPCVPEHSLAVARCTVEQVWARAVADNVPKDALAKISLADSAWSFVIEDKARSVDIRKSYPDDCPLQVEKPRP